MIKRLALALCLLTTPAVAGSITITVTNDAAAVVGQKTYIISTASLARLIAVMKGRYGQVPSGPPDVVTGIAPMRDRTNGEALSAWFDGFMTGSVNAVTQDEGAAAANAASKAVVPITAQ